MKRTVTLLALPLLAISASAAAQTPDFSKVEIKAETLAPGVAVLFGAGGNIGVSHGPDGTVLIDDQFAPLTGKIEAAVTALGATPGASVSVLISTLEKSGACASAGAANSVAASRMVLRIMAFSL